MRYKIFYRQIYKYGYVRLSIIGKNGAATKKPATNFRFKFICYLCCCILNCNNDLTTYSVAEFKNLHMFNFIKHCLLFREKDCTTIGLLSWFVLLLLIIFSIITTFLIYQYIQL